MEDSLKLMERDDVVGDEGQEAAFDPSNQHQEGQSSPITNQPLLTKVPEKYHLERAKVLLNEVKKEKKDATTFSDDKVFDRDKCKNCSPSRWSEARS